MPFIDPNFLPKESQPISRLLITSADDSNVIYTALELAKILEKKENTVLWVDGNLGEQSPSEDFKNQNLERVLSGQLPLTEAIQKIENVSVLAGITHPFLAELSDMQQYRFLQDLKKVYPNFDKVILSVDGKNPVLQKKWMNEAENTYLLFNTKNLLLNRTLAWLKENDHHVNGLIGIGKNDQEVLLAYMRLKEVLGDIPELILDIKKIAP